MNEIKTINNNNFFIPKKKYGIRLFITSELVQIFRDISVDLYIAHDNGISTPTKHKTRASIKFNFFPEM